MGYLCRILYRENRVEMKRERERERERERDVRLVDVESSKTA